METILVFLKSLYLVMELTQLYFTIERSILILLLWKAYCCLDMIDFLLIIRFKAVINIFPLGLYLEFLVDYSYLSVLLCMLITVF